MVKIAKPLILMYSMCDQIIVGLWNIEKTISQGTQRFTLFGLKLMSLSNIHENILPKK